MNLHRWVVAGADAWISPLSAQSLDEQYEFSSARSEVGMQMSATINAPFGVLIPQLNADWFANTKPISA